jgi:hypothetical protein
MKNITQAQKLQVASRKKGNGLFQPTAILPKRSRPIREK